MLSELSVDNFWIEVRFVRFIEGNDNRDVGSLRLLKCFNRLCTHAFVTRDDEYDDIRDVSTSCSHGGKGFMARRIENRDVSDISMALESANVLCDGPCFACSEICFADRIDQARFTMIDVAHKGNDRRSDNQ